MVYKDKSKLPEDASDWVISTIYKIELEEISDLFGRMEKKKEEKNEEEEKKQRE